VSWTSIADIVQGFRGALPRVAGVTDIRQAGAGLALSSYGLERVQDMPELVNFGVLTVLAQPFRVHELRGSVRELVANTDLHSLPDEPPELLRRAWIVQTRDPATEHLFGDTAALAGYELEGTRYLIGLGYPDGCRVARWRPEWRGGEIGAGVVREDSGGLVDDVEDHEEWAREAARFIVVLGLLLDAEGSPLEHGDEGPALAGTRHGKPRPARPWAVRRIYLQHERIEGTSRAAGSDSADIDDRIASEVRVTGHLKRQPYGPDRALRKWLYVQSYEARRWFTARPTKVVVS
jgi:hypothetical protein